MRRYRQTRRGSTLVEVAIIGPVTFLLVMGLMVGGMGVFRYQQVARLASDASRWASVHGTQYATDTHQPAATATDVYNNAIAPYATGLDLSKLTYSVAWNTSNSPSHTVQSGGSTKNVANTVSVTITYQWMPQMFVGNQTFTCTSVRVMTY